MLNTHILVQMKRGLFVFFLLLVLTSFKKDTPPLTPIPKVSVICPTFGRHEKHPFLYACFNHQTYPNRELLVLDDSPSPSLFFLHLKDERVKYTHISPKTTIGDKRNMLCYLATGELIAQFDDDDYYAPEYLEKMVKNLGDADLVKLSKWVALRELDGTFWQWDTHTMEPTHYEVSGWEENTPSVDMYALISEPYVENFLDSTVWGYGFSYLYRKSLWEKNLFPDRNHGEDYEFVLGARALGLQMIEVPDDEMIVLHTIHPKSTSKIFPQRQL